MTDSNRIADAIATSGCDPEWLCSQLEAWPRIVDPSKPTNAEHLMESAATMLRTMLAVQVAPSSAHKVPTGDFCCHNCKNLVRNVVVAPKRCPVCRCRDFSAVWKPADHNDASFRALIASTEHVSDPIRIDPTTD